MCHPAVPGPTLEPIRVSGKVLLIQGSSDSYASWFNASLKSWQRVSSATNRKYRVAWCSRMFQLLILWVIASGNKSVFATALDSIKYSRAGNRLNWNFSQWDCLAKYVLLNFRVSQANYSLSSGTWSYSLGFKCCCSFQYNQIFLKCFW